MTSAYLIFKREYLKDLGIAAYAEKPEAFAALEALPDEGAWNGLVVASEEDVLRALPTSKGLVDLFNALGGEPVARFETRAAGARRLLTKIAAADKSVPPTGGGQLESSPEAPSESSGAADHSGDAGEEGTVAAAKKKAGAKKASTPKAKKAPGEKKPKGEGSSAKIKKGDPLTDVQQTVHAMIGRANGATLEEIMERTELSEGSARNAVGRVRKKTGEDIGIVESGERRAYKVR